MTAGFSLEIIEDIKQLNSIFKVVKEKTDNLESDIYLVKLVIRNDIEIKTFSDRHYLRESVSDRLKRNTRSCSG